MLGVVPLAMALALTAGRFDLIGTASSETRAGEAPLVANRDPEPTLMEIAIPGVELVYRDPRLTIQATYQLRIFWRSTEEDTAPSPLYLHAVGLAVTGRPTRRLTANLAATVFEGAADYTYLPVIFGTSQATLVTVPRVFSTTVAETTEVRATRRLTPALTLEAMHSEPVGTAQAATGVGGVTTAYTLPNATTASAEPALKLRLSHRTEGWLSTAVAYQRISGITVFGGEQTATGLPTSTLSVGVIVPSVGSKVRLSRAGELKLQLGVAFAHFLSDVQGDQNDISPNADVQILAPVLRLRRCALSLLGSASVHYYVDPVLAIAAPRGAATGGVFLALPGPWSIGLDGTFASPFEAHHTPDPVNPIYPDEITASATLRIRHVVSSHAALEFGAHWADRSPFFTAPTYGFHQRQLWMYVLVSGTTRATRVAADAIP